MVSHHCSSLKELKQAKNLGAGADAEAMKSAAYWFVQLLSTSPEMTPPTKGWFLPYQSLTKKMSYRLIHSNHIKHFLCRGSFHL